MFKIAVQVSPGWERPQCCRDPPAQLSPAPHCGLGLGTGAAPAPRQQNGLLSRTCLLLPKASRAVCGGAEAARRPHSRAWHPTSAPCAATSAVWRCCLRPPALGRAAGFISNPGDSQVTVTLGLRQQSRALQCRAPSQERAAGLG